MEPKQDRLKDSVSARSPAIANLPDNVSEKLNSGFVSRTLNDEIALKG
jgi:hypothetical protein